MSQSEKRFKAKEAAKYAGVSLATISKAIREGKLVASQISDSSKWGYHYRITESALYEWVEDRKTVKANAIVTSKVPSEMTIEDIAKEITLRIQKAYDAGFKDGKKVGKTEAMEAVKGVKV